MKKTVITLDNPQGIEEDMTADEIAKLQSIQTDFSEKVTQQEEEANAKATAKANGNQKLLDLGLTQEEATALTGYTPPEE